MPGTETELQATQEQAILPPETQPELVEPAPGSGPLVAVVMGSQNDMNVMREAVDELKERGIAHEVKVMSAHREPEMVREFAQTAHIRGIKVVIAGAGMAAALPGMIASHTDLPVIGVPISAENGVAGGLDALLSIAQAPPGVPVACVAINGARNAASLAARILYS